MGAGMIVLVIFLCLIEIALIITSLVLNTKNGQLKQGPKAFGLFMSFVAPIVGIVIATCVTKNDNN